MTEITLCGIAAMSENRVIGRDNALPWHIPADFKFFKATTLGRPIIMGRKSWESLGKALPRRANIVVTRSDVIQAISDIEGPFPFDSMHKALAFARQRALQDKVAEIFIIGGGEIFRQTLPLIQRLYLTIIHRDYEGDIFFPDFNRDEWRAVHEERHEGDPAYSFFTLERKSS